MSDMDPATAEFSVAVADLDADTWDGNKMPALVAFLSADDARVLATVERSRNSSPRSIWCNAGQDAGDKGRFICRYWLTAAKAIAGQLEQAREAFDAVIAYGNDFGPLSEEANQRDDSLIANFRQALSHIRLINAAWAIARRRRGAEVPCAIVQEPREQ